MTLIKAIIWTIKRKLDDILSEYNDRFTGRSSGGGNP